MPFGAEFQPDGRVRFRLWAPKHDRIELQLDASPQESSAETRLPLKREADGWHELTTDRARAGSRYRYRLPDGLVVPDPASRFQPEDVHGPSEVIDPAAYSWRDARWAGRPWHEAIVYELHIGTFTAEGTFQAAIARLDHLVELGITAIELLPVADFPGSRNWGYDGVLPFAPDSSYGRPEDLKALIDAAHARGLMVIQDVVYNHFGPDGNYLSAYAPAFFTDRHQTPWGAAINFDAPGSDVVREFVVQNALYWLQEFHFDGLRLDAVHAIRDDSGRHLLDELAQRVRTAVSSRPVHLILENEHNEAGRLRRPNGGYDAQWNDDVHHVLHVAATGEREGYYADYVGDSERLARALAQGFAYQGELMPYRGSPRGKPSADLPPTAFVAFLQNHDQIGNRALGERLTALAPAPAVLAVTATYLLLPQIPMLFMGEEWHSNSPFQFFCDFEGDLADAVRDGRRQEFARFAAFASESAREKIPDPLAPATFEASKLDWQAATTAPHAGILQWYRDLLGVRARRIVPLLPQLTRGAQYRVIDTQAVWVQWQTTNGAELTLTANLSARTVTGFPEAEGSLLWEQGQIETDGAFPAWTVRWMLRS
jgi:malto-oligosyltrehalose trehalohydrolase